MPRESELYPCFFFVAVRMIMILVTYIYISNLTIKIIMEFPQVQILHFDPW